MSPGQLDDLGCKVELQNKIVKIIKGIFVLMKGKKGGSELITTEMRDNGGDGSIC